ncbi:hypothetical protein, partial [Marivirga sp.]|uniref:hypothetical protein n=1 Tax=Marivirga sp. TaxID=2018662 RepID=UPI0025D0BCD5
IGLSVLQAQVKIGDNPSTIHASSLFELESTTKGLLMVRMTTAQRDSMDSPPNGMQIYNTTTNSLDVFTGSNWSSMEYTHPTSNVVHVYSLDDLPTPSGSEILLDSVKMYIFSGIVNISPYYLNLNGAGLKGNVGNKDGVMSNISGAVLRSTDKTVSIDHIGVFLASSGTKAYDFADATGTKFCFIFIGNTVIEVGIPSLGVGQISGFKAIYMSKNYWDCSDGVKITGNVGLFIASEIFISNISAGSGIEFLAGLTIGDIDLSNNYFYYTGQTGVKVNAGAVIDNGRMSTNMFRGPATNISGFDSYTPGWEMSLNSGVPNSRSYGYLYMVENTTATLTDPNNTYVKLAGATTSTTLQKFSSPSANRLTYLGKRNITAKILMIVNGKSPANSAEFTMALAKNGTVIEAPRQSTGSMVNNQAFSLIMELEISMETNDYIEVFLKTTSSISSVTISDLQFRVVD